MPKASLVTLTLLLTLAVSQAGCCVGRGRTQQTEELTIAGPGFSPDPMTTSGQAGGTMQAYTLASSDTTGAGCAGSIPTMPQHVLHLGAALPQLRVLVNSSEDTTLVVRAPDGRYYCNDDSGDPLNGLNPLVEIASAPPGDYSIYVGAFSEQAMLSTYSIGFTTTPGTYPSQVVR